MSDWDFAPASKDEKDLSPKTDGTVKISSPSTTGKTIKIKSQPVLLPKLDMDAFLLWIAKLNPEEHPAYKSVIRNNQGKNARPEHVKMYWALFQFYFEEMAKK